MHSFSPASAQGPRSPSRRATTASRCHPVCGICGSEVCVAPSLLVKVSTWLLDIFLFFFFLLFFASSLHSSFLSSLHCFFALYSAIASPRPPPSSHAHQCSGADCWSLSDSLETSIRSHVVEQQKIASSKVPPPEIAVPEEDEIPEPVVAGPSSSSSHRKSPSQTATPGTRSKGAGESASASAKNLSHRNHPMGSSELLDRGKMHVSWSPRILHFVATSSVTRVRHPCFPREKSVFHAREANPRLGVSAEGQ